MHGNAALTPETPASPWRSWRIRQLGEVTSTNETILAAGEQGEPEGTVHIARRQTRGRGRGSHTWWSPDGRGLWMSVLLRPAVPPGRLGGIALVAGVAVRAALESLGARGIDLYWPNDLYFRGRKLGGVLGEVRLLPPAAGGADPALVALGVGVNLDLGEVEPPPELRGRVACAAEAGARERDPEAVARRVLDLLGPLYRKFLQGMSIPALVADALGGMGVRVRVRVHPEAAWDGTTLGIGPEGELLVQRDGGGVEALRAAEVDYGN